MGRGRKPAAPDPDPPPPPPLPTVITPGVVGDLSSPTAINSQLHHQGATINARLYRQVDVLLTQLEMGEHVTIKERYMALVAIGRIQTIFMGLRKERLPDDTARIGSSVRQYASEFQKTYDAGRGAAAAGPDEPAEPDTIIDDLLGDRDDIEAAE